MYSNYDTCMVILPSLGCTINNANIAIMYDNLPFCDNYISIGFYLHSLISVHVLPCKR